MPRRLLQAQAQAFLERMEALEGNTSAEEDAAASPPWPGRKQGAAGGGASAFAKAAAAVFGNGSAAEGMVREENGDGPAEEVDADREGSIAAIVERSLQRAVEIKTAGVVCIRFQGFRFLHW